MNFLPDIRAHFPILRQKMRGKPLVYLDTAATALKPTSVTERMHEYYHAYCANINRGVYEYSELASTAYEEVRQKVRRFFSMPDNMKVVFTSGSTDGINLIAPSLKLMPGDEIVLSVMEHHSNLLPWQRVSKLSGAILRYIPLTSDYQMDPEEICRMFSPRTRICALTGMSNITGYLPQLNQIIPWAKEQGVRVIVDGAQLASHSPVDLSLLAPDVFVCSAHKLYGPTGVGILCASRDILEDVVPYRLGGGMVVNVKEDRSVWAPIPERFEGGTPNIAGVIGMGAGIDFLQQADMRTVNAHEQMLYTRLVQLLEAVEGVRILGRNDHCTAVCSFVVDGIHAHDIGTLLDQWGIATRTGHHCAQPFLEKLEVKSTVRISFGVYNTIEETEFCVDALKKVLKILR